MIEDDYMELGESGLVAQSDGTYLNVNTGQKITAEGQIYDQSGKLVYDPNAVEAEDEQA